MNGDFFTQLFSNPQFQLGLNLLAANAPSTDPRAQSPAWSMAKGLEEYMKWQGVQQENKRREEYLDLQQQYLQRRLDAEQAEIERQKSLSGVIGRATEGLIPPGRQESYSVQGGDVGLMPGSTYGGSYEVPPQLTPEQQRARMIRELAATDPDKALELMTRFKMFDEPKPRETAPPHYWGLIPEEERPAAARIAAGLEPRAVAFRPRTGRSGGGGSSPAAAAGGLSKAQATKRQQIAEARRAVASIASGGADPVALAKENPGFGKQLTLANERMPGGDPTWDAYNRKRAAKSVTASLQKHYDTQIAGALAARDKVKAERLRKEARQRGITPNF